MPTGERGSMARLKWSATYLVLPFVACLVVIFLLTEAAYVTTASLNGAVPGDFARWTDEDPAGRFDDLTDDQVLANIVYRIRDPRFSFWTYFFPPGLPPHDVWSWLKNALHGNELTLVKRETAGKRTDCLHHYWTGHMVLTAWVWFVVPSLWDASRLIQSLVAVFLFVYVLAWHRQFGAVSAIVLAFVMLGTGVLRVESFHNNNWGMIVAFAGATYCGISRQRGDSSYPAAVVSACLACWVGYDHVLDTLAFSLPFFLTRGTVGIEANDLRAPMKFALAFLFTAAAMLAMRILVTYLDGQDVSTFLAQIWTQFAHHLSSGSAPLGDYLKGGEVGGIAREGEVSRVSAISGALPMYHRYLFCALGRIAPRVETVWGYTLFQSLPLLGILAISAAYRKRLDVTWVFASALLLVIACLFHVMFLVFVNHSYIHPWMDVRHMVFWSAIGWALAASWRTRPPRLTPW
ncbi:MAG: hypothetical protein AB1646_08595 [Thermodesulfobacteriota bacterium]